MNFKKDLTIIISFFALVLVAFIIFAYVSRSNYEKYERTTLQNCLQLKVGMTREEVKAIMGEPRAIQDSEFRGTTYEHWYFDAPRSVSEPPICRFDKEKGTLEDIYCGEHVKPEDG